MQDENTQAGPSTGGTFAGGKGRDDGEGYYLNEAGFVVFTKEYLLERGYCCGNGCKHCPYGYKAVPEPRRSALLAKRREHER